MIAFGRQASLVVEDRPLRDLFELALDNAVEGCVRETYGALVGTYQALAAKDPAVANAMREIAEDETRHASLSWAIAAWAEPQLTDAERARIDQARTIAIAELRAEMSLEPDPALKTIAGLPSARRAVAWVDELTRSIWA